MANVQQIFEYTIKSLKQKGLNPIPNLYAKEYCKSAKKLDLNPIECKKFEEFVQKLSKRDQKIIQKNQLETFEDVMQLLLQKVEQKSLKKIAELLNNSLQPSIALIIDELIKGDGNNE